MEKYFYTVSFGLAGCEGAGVLEAKDLHSAEECARVHSIENAEMFGFYQDEDVFQDLDTVGKAAEDEDEEFEYPGYEETGSLEYYVELYVPEKHDDLI
jgi:hypothetical protein